MMRNRFLSFGLFAVAASVGGACAVAAVAQTVAVEVPGEAQSARWAKLEKVNSAAKAVHVVWHRVQRFAAQPDNDPEKRAQSTMEWARKKGMDEAKVLELGEIERKHALDSRKERVIESTLDFVRIGGSVLCNAFYPAPELSERFIEFYDGTNALHATNEFEGEIRTPSARITRDPESILYMSVFGQQTARFLLAIPLDQEFSPKNPALTRKNAKIRGGLNGEWNVARDAHPIEGQTEAPETLTFGGEGAYLTSHEDLTVKSIIVDKNNEIIKIDYEPFHKIVASEFKLYENGVWFPSKIIETWFNNVTEYTLIEAQFNENVDPLGLTLPPDLRLNDTRFGEGPNTVAYTTTDGRLLTDEELKMKMAER